MKKFLFFSLTALLAMALACNKENKPADNNDPSEEQKPFAPKTAQDFVGTVWVWMTESDGSSDVASVIAFSEDGARTYLMDIKTRRVNAIYHGEFSFTNGYIQISLADAELSPRDASIDLTVLFFLGGNVEGGTMPLFLTDKDGKIILDETRKYVLQKDCDLGALLQEHYYPVAIDMGTVVNGKKILWASCNLGASKEYEYGDYYAWGETITYYSSLDPLQWGQRDGKELHYDWTSYIHANGNRTALTKYCPDTEKGRLLWQGKTSVPDGKTTLLPEDDAAHAVLGGKWRMPTKEEFKALIDLEYNSDYDWDDDYECLDPDGNKIKGFLFSRKSTGATLFFPSAGFYSGNEILVSGITSGGRYWSSSLDIENPQSAFSFFFSLPIVTSQERTDGFPIRPVWEE